MRVFLTGASGFIGGAVAAALVAAGHEVRGLVRREAAVAAAADRGVEPVLGVLDDAELLAGEARRADAVISCASSDHRGAVEALLAGLEGSGKTLLHTSGSSVVSDEAMGEPSDRIFHEGSPITPLPDRRARVALDRRVLEARGVRSAVLCCTLIYGKDVLARQAASGRPPVYVGRGLNRWSNVHIDDVADLYVLGLAQAAQGFAFVESGEAAMGDVVRAFAGRFGLEPPRSLAPEEAVAALGREAAVFALGSNSRVRGALARDTLGWRPKHRSILDWIESADLT